MKRHLSVLMLTMLTLMGTGTLAWAQEQAPPNSPPVQQPQAEPAPQQVWSPNQLDNLVAPIALFPDPLLGQMLVASTYPLEVVEAAQWSQRNRNLHGQALADAARKQPWDPSVQALSAVPDALAKLNQDIRWTTDLGNAFLAQEADVMNAVQRMRARAQDDGKLATTPQQTVTTQAQGEQRAIIIQPADPQVIYVPAYDPAYVWGPPLYGYYPPLYYPSFGFGFGFGFNLGFYFGDWLGWGAWGWGPSWYGHCVYVNHSFFGHYGYHNHYHGGWGGRSVWSHDSGHRMGVPYSNHQVATRFGGSSNAYRNSFQAGAGTRGGSAAYTNRSAGSSIGRTGNYGSRSTISQGQRTQNPPRQSSQQSQQYRSNSQQNRSTPQEYRSAPQQYRSAPQQYRSVQPQARSTPQISAPQQFRSAPQQFRPAPQASAPRISGGNFGGGSRGSGNSFGGGRSFSSGGGRSFSGGGARSSGGGGGRSSSGGGGRSSGGGGGGHRR